MKARLGKASSIHPDCHTLCVVCRPRATKRRGKVREVQKAVFNPNQAYIEAQKRQEEVRRLNKILHRQRQKQESKKKIIRTPKKRRSVSQQVASRCRSPAVRSLD